MQADVAGDFGPRRLIPDVRPSALTAARRGRQTGREVSRVLELFALDVRHAARSMWRDRGFSLSAIATLTLGVGAVTALAAVAAGVLLTPLPYHAPDRLVAVLHGQSVTGPVSPADFDDIRSSARSFSGIAAAQSWGANLTADGRTERIPALQVSGRLFQLLGVGAAAGRTISEADVAADARVVVIAHGLWQRRFGGDPSLIGRMVTINGEAWQVVGVMPPAFHFAPFWQTRAQVWVPLSLTGRAGDREGRSLRVFARLAEGVSLDQARAEISAINARLAAAWPASNTGLTMGVATLTAKAQGAVRPLVLAVFGLAAGLLLVAAVNLAMLALARATQRQTEWSIRAALGASHARLLAEAAIEGLLIALAGAAGGALLALTGTRLLLRLVPADSLPPHAAVSVSAPVVIFAAAVALAASLVATLAPAASIARRLSPALGPVRAPVGGPGAGRARRLLVGAEVALAFALAAAALLFARTLSHLERIDPGFEADGVVALSVSLDGAGVESAEARTAFFTSLVTRVAASPGVASASAINHLPIAGDLWQLAYAVAGRPEAPPGEAPRAAYRVVLPGYFRTMKLPLLSGRDFTEVDREAAVPVAIVNRTLAERQWPGRSAIGQRLRFEDRMLTVIGVAADAAQSTLVDPVGDELYLPLAQRPLGSATRSPMTLVARTRGDVPVLGAMRVAVWNGDARAAAYDGLAMHDVLVDELWRQRLGARVGGLFALAAVLLAALGIAGVVGYTVAQRWREFGVRLALGATRRHVVALALVEAAIPLAAGLAAGLGLALAQGRLISGLLAGVHPEDPLTLLFTAALITGVGLLAAWRPASRASRVDPASALRT